MTALECCIFLTVYCQDGYEVASADSCKICPRGTFKDNNVYIFGTCMNCPEGKTTAEEGAVSIENCSIGKSFIT